MKKKHKILPLLKESQSSRMERLSCEDGGKKCRPKIFGGKPSAKQTRRAGKKASYGGDENVTESK